ncbi:hypothetical protein HYALB_00013821 [Hymenoscyphus albidus]|uniref:Uncharacterized protein n=1 Tax=Hymenoscyphus albidus TaxID=595503 RepID=A0A9N9Q6R5_9HELO|nr:hypothetical protein HYALB_00013821 [Hymenoscyphus albidus]
MRPAVAIAIILLAFVTIAYKFYGIRYVDTTTAIPEELYPSEHASLSKTPPHKGSEDSKHDSQPSHPSVSPPKGNPSATGKDWDPSETYHEVFSVSTKDKKFFYLQFGDQRGINPNIIPHPTENDTWIMVSQWHNDRIRDGAYSFFFSQIACNAVFEDGKLVCNSVVTNLPIAATTGPHELCADPDKVPAYFGLSLGSHDARLFYGPETPYVLYGSISMYTCFSQWMLDFRILVDWPWNMAELKEAYSNPWPFREATEIERPPPFGIIEKNWFVFWDSKDEMYMHMDIAPKRSFAKFDMDGKMGKNLEPMAFSTDERCIDELMPKAPRAEEHLEDIHQATNSLKITLCVRADPDCKPDDTNTFIMAIFHHKTFFDWHGVYDPFVLLFQQSPPFAIHGVSQKPIWFHGRGGPGEGRKPDFRPDDMPWNQTQMLFTTSISWKQQGLTYHGYLDDVMFVGFGVEDRDTAAIDVMAGDLLGGMALCGSLID